MGQLRTINHPGIEIQEIDKSGATEQVGGCTSLVVGFFPQGKSGEPVNPTTLSSVKSYFGTPETEAERYAYYGCKSVFDNGGKLIAARIPYDNNSQYITPAVKYNIEEWSTTHATPYSVSDTATECVYITKYQYTQYEHTTKADFYEDENPHISMLTLDDEKTIKKAGEAGTITTKNIFVINSDVLTSDKNSYYTIEFNTPFNTTIPFMWEDETKNLVLNSPYFSGIGGDYSRIELVVESDTPIRGNFIGENAFACSESASSKAIYDSDVKIAEIVANNDGINLDGTFTIYTINEDDEKEELIEINSIIYQETELYSGMELNIMSEQFSNYFTITKHENGSWGSPSVNRRLVSGGGYYSETELKGDEKASFIYQLTRSEPTTALVEKFTPTLETEKVIAIKSYYKSGEKGGVVYPSMTSEDFLNLRIWDDSKITKLEDLTENNIQYFDIIHTEYVGRSGEEYTSISNSFMSAPITSDVTVGYGEISEKLKINGCEVWDNNNYPETQDIENPVGDGYIKVLLKFRPNDATIAYSENDFYQFVSPYNDVKDVALAKSENYRWIHYTVASTADDKKLTGDFKKQLLLSQTLGCIPEAVPQELAKIENLVTIIPDGDNLGYIPLQDYLDYRDEAKKVQANTIVVANITEQKFGKDEYNNTKDDVIDGSEVLGIVPVLMSGFQALPKQSRIELPDTEALSGGITNSRIFNALEEIVRGSSIENDPAPEADRVIVKSVVLNEEGFVKTLGNKSEYDPFESTYSNTLIANVPSIELNSNYKPNGSKVNYVTLVVCQLSLSKVNDNKVALTVLESFTGSLDAKAKGADGNSVFIDNVVNNEESGSSYVKLFSNYQNSLKGSEIRTESLREVVYPSSVENTATIVVPASCGSKKWWNVPKKEFSIGFTEEQTKKYISYATMVATLENVYDALSNVDELDIDLIVDAGISSIANRIKRHIDANPDDTKCEYDPFTNFDKIDSVTDVAGWKSMCAKYITFCQTTRKDCIALIDSPRSLCVKSNAKLIDSKKTTTTKYSVDYDILPKFNYLGGLNSSYGAGFATWLLAVDDFTAKNIWMPPSIAANGNIIYTDYNSNYWMPPAGQSRGNILWAVDVAFNPNAAQQDSIYSKNWNYAISASGNIMTWGQKTFLSSTSSFNRINVRRLFCRLERLVRKNSKWVIFEINNEKTRNVYKDRIDPILNNVKAMGGIYDYQIICDNRNNTPAVRQQNEFRAAFLIKPEYAAEFIILTFFNLNQDMDFSEVYNEL